MLKDTLRPRKAACGLSQEASQAQTEGCGYPPGVMWALSDWVLSQTAGSEPVDYD